MTDHITILLPPLGTSGYIVVGERDDAIIQYFDCISTWATILMDDLLDSGVSVRFLPDGVFVVREESKEEVEE